jgi:hypothetical protein
MRPLPSVSIPCQTAVTWNKAPRNAWAGHHLRPGWTRLESASPILCYGMTFCRHPAKLMIRVAVGKCPHTAPATRGLRIERRDCRLASVVAIIAATAGLVLQNAQPTASGELEPTSA